MSLSDTLDDLLRDLGDTLPSAVERIRAVGPHPPPDLVAAVLRGWGPLALKLHPLPPPAMPLGPYPWLTVGAAADIVIPSPQLQLLLMVETMQQRALAPTAEVRPVIIDRRTTLPWIAAMHRLLAPNEMAAAAGQPLHLRDADVVGILGNVFAAYDRIQCDTALRMLAMVSGLVRRPVVLPPDSILLAACSDPQGEVVDRDLALTAAEVATRLANADAPSSGCTLQPYPPLAVSTTTVTVMPPMSPPRALPYFPPRPTLRATVVHPLGRWHEVTIRYLAPSATDPVVQALRPGALPVAVAIVDGVADRAAAMRQPAISAAGLRAMRALLDDAATAADYLVVVSATTVATLTAMAQMPAWLQGAAPAAAAGDFDDVLMPHSETVYYVPLKGTPGRQ